MFVIGIAGGTGSGKTTLAGKIFESLGEAGALILHQDAYYRDRDALPVQERHGLNFDHPEAFDWPLLLDQVRQLRRREPIEMPVYDFQTHTRMPRPRRVEPRPVILIEGILILDHPGLRSLMDLKLFVDTDADVRFIRRLERDIRERGRSADSVMRQYLETVRPMHLEFVEPSRRHADLIVPEGGHNAVAIDVVLSQIRARAGIAQPGAGGL